MGTKVASPRPLSSQDLPSAQQESRQPGFSLKALAQPRTGPSHLLPLIGAPQFRWPLRRPLRGVSGDFPHRLPPSHRTPPSFTSGTRPEPTEQPTGPPSSDSHATPSPLGHLVVTRIHMALPPPGQSSELKVEGDMEMRAWFSASIWRGRGAHC